MVFGSAHAFCASRMLHHSSSSYSKRKNDNSSTTDAERPRKKIKKTNYFDKDIIRLSKYHDKVYFHSLLNSDDISSHQESYRIISNKESNKQLLSPIFTLDKHDTFVIQNITCSDQIPGNVDEKYIQKNIEVSIFENEEYDNPRIIYIGKSINSLYNCNIKIHGSDTKKFQIYVECQEDLKDIIVYFEGDVIRKDTNK